MGLGDFFRLSAFLARLARQPEELRGDPRVVEEPGRQTDAGTGYDWYRPARGKPRTALIAVHGVTCNGGHDPRLIHFARCLARSRVACAVPTLEGLATRRWDPSDLDALQSVVSAAAADAACPVGLIGFSYGGSYCLVVAARSAVAERVAFVVTIGAYSSLERVFDWYIEHQHERPETEAEWDDAIYLRLVLSAQHGRDLGLPAALVEGAEDLLGRYCVGASAGEKRRFFDERLAGLTLEELGARRRDEAALRALSPAGRLHGLRCLVSLIHDERDSIVPPSEAAALHAELAALPDGERHIALVTSLLSHVDLASALRVSEVRRLYRALGPLLGL